MSFPSPSRVLRCNTIPSYCAFTTQHPNPDHAQTQGAPPTAGLGMPNGGLQVVNPSDAVYDQITKHLASSAILDYDFADQSLLSSLFPGRWVALPYTYNALKTLRDCHKPIWRDEQVKNVHILLSPKPWDEEEGKESQETHKWWWRVNRERLNSEKAQGIEDGF